MAYVWLLRFVFNYNLIHPCYLSKRVPADLCLTGLQISTNQRTTRKQLLVMRSFESVSRNEIYMSLECCGFYRVYLDIYFISLVENRPFRNCAGNWGEFQILTNQ